MLRFDTNQAIARGVYQVGRFYDLAWIAPWLCYAWAAAEAPASPPRAQLTDDQHETLSVTLLVVPALLIPLIGYGVLNLESAGDTVDSVRLFLTSLSTVVGLGIVTLRLAAQGTELQRADARLQLLAAATEHTGDLILITRPDGTFEHANAAFLRAFGYTRAELTSLSFVDLIEPGMDHVRRDILAEVMANSIWRGTLKGRRKDGSSFPAACTITALRDSAGRVTHFVGVERDMTEDLALRDQLVHSERLSAIGELIAGVAHEINNPLQTIIGCTELMLDESDASNRHDLELVRKEAMRAGQIVRNLLAFARRGVSDRTPIDLNELVRATAELREYHFKQVNIRLVLRCAPHPLPVAVNREEIRQVILNLLINAEHAIASSSGSGTITVETSGNGVRADGRGDRQRPRDQSRAAGKDLRTVLHDAGSRRRHRPRAVDLARHRVLPRRDARARGVSFRGALQVDAAGPRRRRRRGAECPGCGRPCAGRGRRRADSEADCPAAREARLRGLGGGHGRVGHGARPRSAGPASSSATRPCRGMTGFDLYRQLGAQDGAGAPRFLFISGDKTSAPPADADVAGVPVAVQAFHRHRPRDGARRGGDCGAADLSPVDRALGFRRTGHGTTCGVWRSNPL